MTQMAASLRAGVIVRVTKPGSQMRGRWAIVDAVIPAWKLVGVDGRIFMMPPLASVRIADGAQTGESFGFPFDWIDVVPVPPLWAIKLRRQAYGLDRPLTPGNSPVPAKEEVPA